MQLVLVNKNSEANNKKGRVTPAFFIADYFYQTSFMHIIAK